MRTIEGNHLYESKEGDDDVDIKPTYPVSFFFNVISHKSLASPISHNGFSSWKNSSAYIWDSSANFLIKILDLCDSAECK